jgi:hypothetical protein
MLRRANHTAVQQQANSNVHSNVTLRWSPTAVQHQAHISTSTLANVVCERHSSLSQSASHFTHIHTYLHAYIHRCAHTSTVTCTHRHYTHYTYITHYTLHITHVEAAKAARTVFVRRPMFALRRQAVHNSPRSTRRDTVKTAPIAGVSVLLITPANSSVGRRGHVAARGVRNQASNGVVVNVQFVISAIIADDLPLSHSGKDALSAR